jgi:hypothetical protein
VELAALEAELSRIPGVTATRVVLDESGAPSEIHVLATPDKPAKQVVRDVQSVALARFDLELDRRIVSVVQLDSPGGPIPPPPPSRERRPVGDEPPEELQQEDEGGAVRRGPARSEPDLNLAHSRIGLMGVSVSRDGHRHTVEVTLSWRGIKAVGWESGSASAAATHRQVALATLAALRQIDPATESTDVETATVMPLGDRQVASVTLVILDPPREEVLSGSAVVAATGVADALARAVLDALNRRLGAAGWPPA